MNLFKYEYMMKIINIVYIDLFYNSQQSVHISPSIVRPQKRCQAKLNTLNVQNHRTIYVVVIVTVQRHLVLNRYKYASGKIAIFVSDIYDDLP